MCIIYREVTISLSKSQFRAKNALRREQRAQAPQQLTRGTGSEATEPGWTLAITARYVEADASIALCRPWVLTDGSFAAGSSTTDATNQYTFINQLQNTNPVAVSKIQSGGNSSSCFCLRTPADSADEGFSSSSSSKYVPIRFSPPIFLQSSVRTRA